MKLDIGCGGTKYKGADGNDDTWVGMDRIRFSGVDWCIDIGNERWPFADEGVSEARSCHFIEHLTAIERVHFCNELYRVLVPGGKCAVIAPHWSSSRAYGDPTHAWPPIGEYSFLYLDKNWRDTFAPHTDAEHWPQGYACDFQVAISHLLNPAIDARDKQFKEHATRHYKEAVFDISATLIKRPMPVFEGMPPSAVNAGARAEMAALAKMRST